MSHSGGSLYNRPILHGSHSYIPIRKVLWYVLWLNLLVAFAKLGFGFSIQSVSLTADGYHSLFDGLSNVIALVGLWVASHPPDHNHQYGHKKFETFATMGIGAMLTVACVHVLHTAYTRFGEPTVPEVGPVVMTVVVATLGVNWFVYKYEANQARALGSDVLHADSKHTQSDLLVTLSVIASLIAAKFNIWLLDPIVAVLIAGLIGKAAYDIIIESVLVLSDAAMLDPKEVCRVAGEEPGILHCHEVRTRGSRSHILMDLRVHVDGEMTVNAAHEIADRLEERLVTHFDGVMEVVVHMEPDGHVDPELADVVSPREQPTP